ncbi:MAG: hypothetical protein HEQ39_13495 [Rhizobacter sp.]
MTTNAITSSTNAATTTFPDAGSNVVPLRTATQANSTTEVGAATQPLSARDKAFQSISNFVESSQKRIAAYDEERKGYLEILKKPMPEPPMKMSEADWTQFMSLKANAMACWNNGSNDCGGKNNREANAINQMDNALTTNGKYQSLEGAKAMIALANANGLQSNGGSFEDGAWQSAFNAIRSYSVAAQTEHEGKVAAWKQEQATAKAGLANVTNLLGGTQKNLGSTVVAFNDLIQKVDSDSMSRGLASFENSQKSLASLNESKKEPSFIDAVTVTVNTPQKTDKPKPNVNVKVAVNIDKDFAAQKLTDFDSAPIRVSTKVV